MATLRYYDDTRFSRFYGYGGGLVRVAAGWPNGTAMIQSFFMQCPGTISGIRLWNVINTSPTLRIGLFINGVESMAQRAEYAACPLGMQDLMFTAPYHANWADLQFQREGGPICFQIMWMDMAGPGGWWQRDTGGKYAAGWFGLTSNHGPMGRCYYACGGFEKQSNGNGWSTAAAGTTSSGCDPIILADEFTDIYEVMHWPYLHGAGHPTIALVPAATSKVQALRFYVTRRDAVVHGLRFYTHDPNPWTASCKLWLGTDAGGVLLASGTIGCNGIGMYDCLYTVPGPVTIDDAIFNTMRGWSIAGIGHFLVATLYNTTNTNYTKTGNEFVLFRNITPFIGNMVAADYGTAPTPSVTAAIPPGGDVFPNTQPNTENYPISPLVTV